MALFDFLQSDPGHKARLQAAEAIRAASEKETETRRPPDKRRRNRLHINAPRKTLPSHLWTGDLSVNELMLVKQAGYEPLGQVMGASIFQVGNQWIKSGTLKSQRYSGVTQEFDTVSRAFMEPASGRSDDCARKHRC